MLTLAPAINPAAMEYFPVQRDQVWTKSSILLISSGLKLPFSAVHALSSVSWIRINLLKSNPGRRRDGQGISIKLLAHPGEPMSQGSFGQSAPRVGEWSKLSSLGKVDYCRNAYRANQILASGKGIK